MKNNEFCDKCDAVIQGAYDIRHTPSQAQNVLLSGILFVLFELTIRFPEPPETKKE